mgnify:CR=1 FL=1
MCWRIRGWALMWVIVGNAHPTCYPLELVQHLRQQLAHCFRELDEEIKKGILLEPSLEVAEQILTICFLRMGELITLIGERMKMISGFMLDLFNSPIIRGNECFDFPNTELRYEVELKYRDPWLPNFIRRSEGSLSHNAEYTEQN